MLCSSVSVIVPVYNEEKTIGTVLGDITKIMKTLNMPYEIIVVNDGSTDNTTFIAAQHNVTLLSYRQNRGKGYALRKAMQLTQSEIIVTIDSDGEHEPKDIPNLLTPILKGADIVSGSRFMNNQGQVTTRLNEIGNFFFNTCILLLTGKRITDSQTGFRAIKRDVLNKLNLQSDGYEIETEITVKGMANGFIYEELPISCERRQYSASKLKIIRDGTNILKTILKANFLSLGNYA
jgi:glycosyltransferase involved in cell wall biosynthesis